MPTPEYNDLHPEAEMELLAERARREEEERKRQQGNETPQAVTPRAASVVPIPDRIPTPPPPPRYDIPKVEPYTEAEENTPPEAQGEATTAEVKERPAYWNFYDTALEQIRSSQQQADPEKEKRMQRSARLNTIAEGLRTLAEGAGITAFGAPVEKRGENKHVLKSVEDYNRYLAGLDQSERETHLKQSQFNQRMGDLGRDDHYRDIQAGLQKDQLDESKRRWEAEQEASAKRQAEQDKIARERIYNRTVNIGGKKDEKPVKFEYLDQNDKRQEIELTKGQIDTVFQKMIKDGIPGTEQFKWSTATDKQRSDFLKTNLKYYIDWINGTGDPTKPERELTEQERRNMATQMGLQSDLDLIKERGLTTPRNSAKPIGIPATPQTQQPTTSSQALEQAFGENLGQIADIISPMTPQERLEFIRTDVMPALKEAGYTKEEATAIAQTLYNL